MPSSVGLLEQRELGARGRLDELREEGDCIGLWEFGVALDQAQELCDARSGSSVSRSSGSVSRSLASANLSTQPEDPGLLAGRGVVRDAEFVWSSAADA